MVFEIHIMQLSVFPLKNYTVPLSYPLTFVLSHGDFIAHVRLLLTTVFLIAWLILNFLNVMVKNKKK